MVLFPGFSTHASSTTDEIVAIALTPKKPGEYELQCQTGMPRGELIVA